jgi:protein SCO1/2
MDARDDLDVMNPRPEPGPARSGPAVLAAVLALVLMALAACGKDQAATELSGYTREPVPDVSKAVLPLADGSGNLAVAAPEGGYRLVYFGFTSCPDVCPTTLSDLKRALKKLPAEQQQQVDVAVMTVDPERDLPEKITEYVATFFPENGTALRASDPAVLSAAAGAFGVSYSAKPGADGAPEVAHSGDLYVVDDRGKVVLQWPFGTDAESMSSDLATLFARQTSASSQ